MSTIPAPIPEELIPPVLACLPTAFISPRPPPALLPFLSPILRQRLHLLASTSGSRSTADSNWLKLLSYSPSRANSLIEIVEDMQLEPHPVSGELEIFTDGEDPEIEYRRRDKETLHSRCIVKQHKIAFVWVWCTRDPGGTGLEALEDAFGGVETQSRNQTQPKDGWKLAELLPFESIDDGDIRLQWHPTIYDANGAESMHSDGAAPGSKSGDPNGTNTLIAASQDSQATSDDEDYWASYDLTPGRSPGTFSPPALQNGASQHHLAANGEMRGRQLDDFSVNDSEYYSRYSTEVQPALDGHDPDEELPGIDSSLGRGQVPARTSTNSQLQSREIQQDDYMQHQAAIAATEYASFMPKDSAKTAPKEDQHHVPVTEPPTNDTDPVQYIAQDVHSSEGSPVDRAITMHIATEIKSLYRLARGAGIERLEFERLVRTELELLDMLEL